MAERTFYAQGMMRVFISYSHETKQHNDRVLAFAHALRTNGCDVELDQFHTEEIIDWPRWCSDQISKEHSDFVLCICTAQYRRRVEGKVPPERGKGVYWEGSLLDDELYDEKGNSRLIPILFDDEPEESIIRILRGWTHCRLRDFTLEDRAYETLIRILSGQARVVKNPVGTVPDLPPDPLPSSAPQEPTSPRTGQPFRPPRAATDVPRQLPSPPTDFIGRDDELAELLDKIGSGGVSISGVEGMAGVGKTALALVLADRLTDDYPGGQFYLDLRGADANKQTPLTPADAMRHVLRSLDPMRSLPEDDDALKALYLSELHDHPALLLMDNAADRTQVEPLIPPSGCLLLVTSRQHFVLPGLKPLNLDTLKKKPARDLLLEICPRIGNHADRIAKLCAYLPLALRVAATSLAERPPMTPARYVARLEEKRLEQLNEVDAAIAVSEALLPNERREHFRALSVFPESFERSAAARVLELEQDANDDELDGLVRCSLLQWDTKLQRYGMHDLIRLFADQRLSDARRGELQMRHARVYCEVLAAADDLYLKHGDQTFQGLALFDREWGNIQAGFAGVSARASSDEDAARLCSAYLNAGVYCLQLRQSTDKRIAWLKSAVDAARGLEDNSMEAGHLGNLGNIFWRRGDLDDAEMMYRKALEIDEKLGRVEGMANAYGNLGTILQTRGDLDEAEKMHWRGLEIDEKLGRLEGMASTYCNLGNMFRTRGELDEAEKMYRKALEIEEKLGRLEGIANQYGGLGIIFHMRGHLDEAEKMYHKALEIDEKLGRLEGMGSQYGNLGIVLKTRGDLDEAEKMFRKSLAIEEKLGRAEGMASDYANLGTVFNRRGNLDEARRLWTKARDLYARIGMPHVVKQMQGWLDGLPGAGG